MMHRGSCIDIYSTGGIILHHNRIGKKNLKVLYENCMRTYRLMDIQMNGTRGRFAQTHFRLMTKKKNQNVGKTFHFVLLQHVSNG